MRLLYGHFAIYTPPIRICASKYNKDMACLKPNKHDHIAAIHMTLL